MPSSMRPTTTVSGVRVVEREIGEGREPEREGDRHAGEHARGRPADEEDHQVELPTRLQRAA